MILKAYEIAMKSSRPSRQKRAVSLKESNRNEAINVASVLAKGCRVIPLEPGLGTGEPLTNMNHTGVGGMLFDKSRLYERERSVRVRYLT